MDKSKRWLLVGVPIVCVGTVVQWIVVLDRIREAVWGWYKFKGYGGGGELTVSAAAQLEFFVASAVLLGAALWMAREARDCRRQVYLLARATMWLLLIAVIVWAAVLGSPLVTWR